MNIYQNLIVITNRKLVQGDFLTQLRRVAALQPRALILREKDLEDAAYKELALQVKAICDERKLPFYLHSHLEIAKEIGCRNIHMSVPSLAQLCEGKSKTENGNDAAAWREDIDSLSISCHSMEDMLFAVAQGADQIVLGTIFETDCKPGKVGSGTEFVREICAACPVPVYAIGGIKEDNLQLVMEAGAAGGCMMSGFMTY